ncbi:MAG: PadR family transcriptional regulator [Bryobacteraceae bacterium]
MPREIPLLGYALLGLLMQGALSGYDIRRIFTRTPMGTFSDSPGAIYPALKRLETDGLVRGRVESSAGLRQRRSCRLTPTGRSRLKRWLRAPITHDDVVHGIDELMLRFSFMDRGIGEAASVRFLRSLQRELKAYIPELKLYLASHDREMPRSGRLALESGIGSYEALLQWTKHALTTYGKGGERS